MGRASVFKLEGRELESRSGRAKFSSSHWGKTMFQVPYSSHILILSGVEAVQACAKKQFFGAQQIAFLQSSFSPHKAIRDDSTKRTTFQFPSHKTHKTSRINSYLRIWQSYPRVLQILKVLCAWYSWKYVAPHWIRARQILIQRSILQYSSCILIDWLLEGTILPPLLASNL